jgi:hypothetical protein
MGRLYLEEQTSQISSNSQNDAERTSSFTWEGKWSFETETDQGDIVMSLELTKDGNGYKGWHCMTDGRILGGASDCTDFSGETPQYTLTNSKIISPNTLEFDFISGYIPARGKARISRINDSTIRFYVTELPDHFRVSPLANYLYLNDGLGADASGGIELTK